VDAVEQVVCVSVNTINS